MSILTASNFSAESIVKIFANSNYASTQKTLDLEKGDLCFEFLKDEFAIDEDYVVSPPVNVKVLNCLVYYVMAEMASDRIEPTLSSQLDGVSLDVWASRESLWNKKYMAFKSMLRASDFYDSDNLPEEKNNHSGQTASWYNI